jgi:hypothetical protein
MPRPRLTPRKVRWKVSVAAPQERVFAALCDPEQHCRYWCEASERIRNGFRFRFIDGTITKVRLLGQSPPACLILEYFNSIVTLEVESGNGGSIVTVNARKVPPAEWDDVNAGWVSVLLAFKLWIERGHDIRSHDPDRTWKHGFVDQ